MEMRLFQILEEDELRAKASTLAGEGSHMNCDLFCNRLVGDFREWERTELDLTDPGEVEGLASVGDVLGFGGGEGSHPRHYAVYAGQGKVYEVPEWGARVRTGAVSGCLDEYEVVSSLWKSP